MPTPRRMPALRVTLAALACLATPIAARAQDAFEIQVYEYETVPKGMWNLETHYNYTSRGTPASGLLFGTTGQSHLTFELTRGITEDFELAGYLVLAHHDGGGAGEVAGWRVRPRVKVPQAWAWPVDVSLSFEFGFPNLAYEENAATFEFRPIIEKKFGDWQVDVNPVLARALNGPSASAGWEFEPNARLAFSATKKLDLSLEYYGATGSLTSPLPGAQQVHTLWPGFDYQFDERTVMNVGVSIPGTGAGDQSVIKLRLGVLFGGK